MGIEYCGIAQPIWFDTPEDVAATPAGVKRQIAEHNRIVERLCAPKT